MKTLLRYGSVFGLLLVPVLLLNLTAAAAVDRGAVGSPGLFSTAAAPAWRSQEAEPTVVRHRLVHVDFSALGNMNTPADAVVLNLFEDVTFTALFDRMDTNALGSFVWTGRLEGVQYGHAVLVVTNGLLAGSVSMPGASFQVAHAGGDVYALQEIDQSAFPPELDPIPVDLAWNEAANDPILMADPCDEITVLVAYSPEARAADGGTTQIQARIAQAVAETNQSYVNSGLTQRLVLVHTMETDPGDAANEFYTDLYALRNLSDGVFDNVDAARETYYADEVALIIEDTSYCGLAYLNSTASYAFSVIHRTCATGYYSFGHELGHNMGARHDWYVDATSNYHKGFVRNVPGDDWRTIMAYNTLCSEQGDGYCSRLQYWSNPDVSYSGDPMGVIATGPMNCVEGSASPDPSSCAADNRTRLNSTCSAVANFRTSPLTPEMDVQGNGVSIADNDTTPSAADDTDFDSVEVGAPAVGHTFTIQNTGDGDLNLTGSPRVAVSGTDAADFSVSAQPTTPVASGGGTTTFTVSFDPAWVGLRSATISIANNDSDEDPYNFDIQGTGTQPPGTGTIIVEKQTVPNGTSQTFEFSTDYGSNFTLRDDETNNSGFLTAGTYSVSEINIPARWSLTSATCDDGSDPSAIGLDAGETVTCVFTNTRDQTTLAPAIMILDDE